MLLQENYVKCFCGAPLKKKTRFAIKLEAPEHPIKKGRDDDDYFFKTLVLYCCEQCYKKVKKQASKIITKEKGWFIYYKDNYPI